MLLKKRPVKRRMSSVAGGVAMAGAAATGLTAASGPALALPSARTDAGSSVLSEASKLSSTRASTAEDAKGLPPSFTFHSSSLPLKNSIFFGPHGNDSTSFISNARKKHQLE